MNSTRPPIRTARMSLQHVPYSQHQTRLSLVPEAPTPQPNFTMQRRQSIQPLEMEHNGPRISSSLAARTQSDTSLYPPVRRRSLLQHGVPTRQGWIEKNDFRQGLPSQVQTQREPQTYYHDPAYPVSSQPTASPNFDPPNFVDHIPGPRVATPDELDYGHIGAFKLGSLRITNGTPSPAPSIERPATMGGEEDYLSAGDRRAGRQRHDLGLRSNTTGVLTANFKPPWVARAESPLRKVTPQEPPNVPLTVETGLPLPEFSLFKFSYADSPTKSLDLAQDYMNDLALSPFSFDPSPPASPTLESTSKHMAVEDDLFEAESNTPDISEARVHRSFDSGYRGGSATPKEEKRSEGQRELDPKPLTKADSGYSSNVSLRSLQGNPAPSELPKEAPPIPPNTVRNTSNTYSVASSMYSSQSDMTIKAKRSWPALPEEYIPTKPSREPPPVPRKADPQDENAISPITPEKSVEQHWAAAQSKSNVIKKHQNGHARSHSIPNVARTKPNHSPAGSDVSTSSASSGSTSRWRSKSKPRSQMIAPPRPQSVYTVQAMRNPADQMDIPPVSQQASKSLEERVDAFPVACFPNTERRNDLMRRTPSKETLGTIFSVGSAELREELTYTRLQSKLPAVPPESIPESPNARPNPDRRHTYQPLVSQITPRRPVRQSLPPLPVNDLGLQQMLQQDFEMLITSVDNISSSLGKSPYDFATSPATEGKRKQQEKAKSMTAQFAADEATRFARARNVSSESQASPRLQRTISYDSISNRNPWTGGSSAGDSRVSSREYPPQTHGNGGAHSMLPPRRTNLNLRPEQVRDSSMSTGPNRISSPPVSIQTQRNAIPVSRTPQTQPSAPPPNRTPPQPSANFSPQAEEEIHDHWAAQKDFWATRKQDALRSKRSMEAMTDEARKIMETNPNWKSMDIPRQPVSSRLAFDAPRPKSAKPSFEYQTRTSNEIHRRPVPSFANPPPRSESARQSIDAPRSERKELGQHKSFDSSDPAPWRPQMPGQQSYGFGYRGPSQEWEHEEHRNIKSYDHTYGSYHSSSSPSFLSSEGPNSSSPSSSSQNNQQNRQHQEEEYYDNDNPSDDLQNQHIQDKVIYTSTSDLLTLDRFAGSLGYGYGPGYGLVGSAGTRSTGKMGSASRNGVGSRMNSGLDFSDLPVSVQRVSVKS